MIEDAGLAMKEEDREEYDQYNDDPTFNNRQREYYNQRSVKILLISSSAFSSQTWRFEEQKGS